MTDMTFDVNVGGNFSATLNQMLAEADQFSKQTDGLVGQIGRLNQVTVGLINSTTGLTGANKVATAQAAAYQEAMAGIDASTKVTHQSFEELRSITLELARSLPGGLSEAVHIVESLQKSGVTAEASIRKLSTTFADLGHANGLDGAALGKELLSLNRVFGNSQDQISGFGDSLTSLSKKYGASADGALAFAKALSPVAAQAGLSEGAVLGLGTAAARLGEDGTAGATAINKVLLDLTRSVRDGTPEIREYARMLNVSASSLTQMFKSDPTDVVVRFTEAIKKGGPDAQRSLEALGFDATRTVRSLQALSSEGNLRQIISDSTKAYGDGSTATAAETAIGGVNDQVRKLSESLSQTVAAAGTPFLGFLNAVLKAANAVSGAIAGIAQSKPVQTLGGLGAVAGFVGGAAIQALGAVSTIALGRRAFNFGRRTINGTEGVEGSGIGESFYRGQTEGTLRENATIAERTAFFVGRQAPKTPTGQGFAVNAEGETVRTNFYAPRTQRELNLGRTITGAAKNTLGLGANVVEAAANFYARDFASADQNGRGPIRDIPRTPAGQVFGYAQTRASEQSEAARATRTQAREVLKTDGVSEAGKVYARSLTESAAATRTMIVGTKDATRAFLNTSESGNRAAKALGRVAFEATAYTGRELKSAGKAAFSGVKGLAGTIAETAEGAGPLVVASVAAGIGLKIIDTVKSATNATTDAAAKGKTDIYGQFNDFAAAAGIAGKGLQSFTEQLALTTTQISNQNTTVKQATTLTKQELDNAASPGYQRAFNGLQANGTAEGLTTQARLMLGPNAAPQAIARVLSDIQNQYGNTTLTTNVGSSLATQNSKPIDYGASLKLAGQQNDWKNTLFGTLNDAQNSVVQGVVSQASAAVNQKTDTYGGEATATAKFAEAKKIYDEGVKKFQAGDFQGAEAAKASVAQLLNTNKTVLSFAGNTPFESGSQNFEQEIKRVRDSETGGINGFFDRLSGVNPDTDFAFLDQYKNLPSGTDLSKPNYNALAKPSELENASVKMSNAFKSVSQDVSRSGHDISEAFFGVARETRGGPKASQLALDVNTAITNPGDLTAQETAGRGLAARSLTQFGSPEMANLSLVAQQDQFGVNSPQRGLLARAQQQLQAAATITQAGSSTYDNTARQIFAARQAKSIGPLADQGLEQQRQQVIAGEAQGYATRLQMMKQFVMASRQLNLQLARQDQDAARDRARANEDFNRQTDHANQDYNRQRANAEFDYNEGVKRSKADYHEAVFRQTRDFNKSITRAEADFDTQRMRSQRDFNKQMKRMVEDAAKDLYDPYKRIQAQQVWDAKSLLTNLKEQNAAITKQTSELAQAQSLGLSQKVIDQLKLSNPENAQQLDRLIQDLKNDPSLVNQYNQSADTRQTAAQGLVENNANDTYRRSVEDFKQSQADATADFEKSIKRSKADFAVSLADESKDFAKNLSRGEADFKKAMARNATEFSISMSRAADEFKRTMSRMATDLTTARARALQDLGLFADDVTGGPQGILTAFNKAINTFNIQLTKIPAKIRPTMGANLKQLWIDAGTDLKTYLDATLKPYGLDSSIFTSKPKSSSQQVTGGGSEHSGHGASTGGTSQQTTGNGTEHSGQGRSNDQNTSRANAHAAGAIVRGPEVALIGEAGPEAVLPLNATGSKFIADMLIRYIGQITVPGSSARTTTSEHTSSSDVSRQSMSERVRELSHTRVESSVQDRRLSEAFARTEQIFTQFLSRDESRVEHRNVDTTTTSATHTNSHTSHRERTVERMLADTLSQVNRTYEKFLTSTESLVRQEMRVLESHTTSSSTNVSTSNTLTTVNPSEPSNPSVTHSTGNSGVNGNPTASPHPVATVHHQHRQYESHRQYTESMVNRKFDEIIKRSELALMRKHEDTVYTRTRSRDVSRVDEAKLVTEIMRRAVESLSHRETSSHHESRYERTTTHTRVDPVTERLRMERKQRDEILLFDRSYANTLRRTPDYSSRAQHVQGQHVRTQRAMEYASVITHNAFNYDQRTQITGPVTVKADDPNKMLRDLRKKVALSRLVQPARASIPTSW
jgi:TP901 family phage tail tape measure protein